VPNNGQKSFKNEADAYSSYRSNKRDGKVEVIHVSLDDDAIYGPVESAIE